MMKDSLSAGFGVFNEKKIARCSLSLKIVKKEIHVRSNLAFKESKK